MGYFETGLLESLFEVFFQDRESGVVADQNGNPIFVNARYLSDYGTLPQAVKITQSYMKLQPGQMAILNDPYSGGTQPSTLTLITCVEIGSKKNQFSDDTGFEISLRPNLRWAESIEDEGLRIPPTLIGDQNGIYEDILSAITNHPLCPDDFGRYINEWFNKTKKSSEILRSGFDIFKTSISKSLIQQYNQSSKKLLEEIISQMPLGESQIKEKLDDGETVQLRIENNGSQLTFDFQGTTNSKKYFLTESAVLGCCLAALKCFTNSSFPINAGSLECLKVNTPTNSWLSSRYPSPSFLGMSEGTRLLSELSLTALSKLGRQKDLAQSSMSLCLVDIEFQSGAHFYDTTPGGVGARNGYNGEFGANIWDRSQLNPSVEDIETRFPISVQRITIRKGSAGRGKFSGGAGIAKTYLVHENGILKWSTEQSNIRPSGAQGGLSGSEAELSLKNSAGETTRLDGCGTIPINAGDTLIIRSAGGGGWGSAD